MRLDHLERHFTEVVIDRHQQRPGSALITIIDFDASSDPYHRSQQCIVLNGFYDTRSYLLLVGPLSFDSDIRGRG